MSCEEFPEFPCGMHEFVGGQSTQFTTQHFARLRTCIVIVVSYFILVSILNFSNANE